MECYYCHKKGHIKKNCWKKNKSKIDLDQEKGVNSVDRVTTTSHEKSKLVYDDSINFACHETRWVIDSGASVHGTSYADLFTSYTHCDFRSVKMGNDGTSNIVGVGDVWLEKKKVPYWF